MVKQPLEVRLRSPRQAHPNERSGQAANGLDKVEFIREDVRKVFGRELERTLVRRLREVNVDNSRTLCDKKNTPRRCRRSSY